jgi:hypothetical protein
MTEEEKTRLEELEAKDEADLTEEEKEELKTLQEQKPDDVEGEPAPVV